MFTEKNSKCDTTARLVSQDSNHIHVTLSASRPLPHMWTSPEAVAASRCPSVIYTEQMVHRSVPSPSGYGWWEVLEIRAETAVTYYETQLRGAMPRASATVQANCPAKGQLQSSNRKKKEKCQQWQHVKARGRSKVPLTTALLMQYHHLLRF